MRWRPRHQECGLTMIKLQEGFFVAIRISALGGFCLSFPYIGYQLWRFVAPGLYKKERNAFLPFLVASPVMFIIGAAFAYYVILPMAFAFFLSFQQHRRRTDRDAGGRLDTGQGRDHLPGLDRGISLADHEVHRGVRGLLPAAGAA